MRGYCLRLLFIEPCKLGSRPGSAALDRRRSGAYPQSSIGFVNLKPAARDADLEAGSRIEMPVLPERSLRATGAHDQAQQATGDIALQVDASGRGSVKAVKLSFFSTAFSFRAFYNLDQQSCCATAGWPCCSL